MYVLYVCNSRLIEIKYIVSYIFVIYSISPIDGHLYFAYVLQFMYLPHIKDVIKEDRILRSLYYWIEFGINEKILTSDLKLCK